MQHCVLQKINEDYLLRLSKAKLYEKYLDTNKIKKFKYYQNENIFLEYPIILKKNNNMLMHKILFNKGYDVNDMGCDSNDSVDYPEFGHQVGKSIVSGVSDKGIVVCGSGIGISIAANKIKGIRAALCFTKD